MLLLALPVLLVGCGAFTSGSRTSTTWTSNEIKVSLTAIEDSAIPTSEFDQYYQIQFTNRKLIYVIPSKLHRTEVKESLSRASRSFGGSGVHFSRSGMTVVVDDDSPGAASSDGHQFIIASMRGEPLVATFLGPERPGVLIEEWPRVVGVTDCEVTFQYDEDRSGFSISIKSLLENAKTVEQDGTGQPATRYPLPATRYPLPATRYQSKLEVTINLNLKRRGAPGSGCLAFDVAGKLTLCRDRREQNHEDIDRSAV